ncbi:MAG: hypothetical protein KGJ98_02765 [Chloroflexota bacterium]|nr:hypothetical protein [Chloroflexota bacterium]MDE3101138.1 hypothetical protein [Chloroflexota bacterium]
MRPRLWHDDPGGHTRPADAAVYWVCQKGSHREAPSRGGRGGLTVYRGRWAYCDGMVDDERHDWAPTGGVPIERLVDWTRALDALRGHTVRR